MAVGEQPLAQMRAEKPGTAGYENACTACRRNTVQLVQDGYLCNVVRAIGRHQGRWQLKKIPERVEFAL